MCWSLYLQWLSFMACKLYHTKIRKWLLKNGTGGIGSRVGGRDGWGVWKWRQQPYLNNKDGRNLKQIEGGCENRKSLNFHLLLGRRLLHMKLPGQHRGATTEEKWWSGLLGQTECWRLLLPLKNCLRWAAWRKSQNFSCALVEGKANSWSRINSVALW